MIGLNTILQNANINKYNDKTEEKDLEKYWEKIDTIFCNKLIHDYAGKKNNNNEKLEYCFEQIIDDMENDIKCFKNNNKEEWVIWNHQELNSYENLRKDNNYADYYASIKNKILDWENERVNAEKIYKNKKITFNGKCEYGMTECDPLAIKNNFELELYKLHIELNKVYKELKDKKLHVSITEPKQYKIQMVNDNFIKKNKYINDNYWDVEERTKEKFYQKNCTDDIEIKNLLTCLIEKNNNEKKNNIDLAEQIVALAKSIEAKKAIEDSDDELEYDNENGPIGLKVSSSQPLSSIIKLLDDVFFEGVAAKDDLCIYEDTGKKKYTVYKRAGLLDDFLSIGRGIDLNSHIDDDIENIVGIATRNGYYDEYNFYSKINEYKESFYDIREPNAIGKLKIEKAWKYQTNKKFKDIQLQLLQEVTIDCDSFLKNMRIREEKKSYYCNEPILQQLTLNSALLYQNGMYKRKHNNKTCESYTNYIERLIRNLDIYKYLRDSLWFQEIKKEDDTIKIVETCKKIEEIYFKLLLLEYNQLMNFDEWWQIYCKGLEMKKENLEELFSRMADKSIKNEKTLFLKNAKGEPIEYDVTSPLKEEGNGYISKNSSMSCYVRIFTQKLDDKINDRSDSSDFNCDQRLIENGNIQERLYESMLKNQKECYFFNSNDKDEDRINNYFYDCYYKNNLYLTTDKKIQFKKSFLEKIKQYNKNKLQDDSINNTDLIVSQMSARHYTVLDEMYTKHMNHNIYSIADNVFQNEYFWRNIISCYKKYRGLEIKDTRLDYYMNQKFKNIFDQLKENQNMVLSGRQIVIDCENDLKKTKKYLLCDKKKITKEYIINNIVDLEYKNLCKSDEKMIGTYSFGSKVIIGITKKLEDFCGFPSLFISNEYYVELKDKFKNFKYEEIGDIQKINSEKLFEYICYINYFKFNHYEYDEKTNKKIILHDLILKKKNNTCKNKNNEYFENNIFSYQEFIQKYIIKNDNNIMCKFNNNKDFDNFFNSFFTNNKKVEDYSSNRLIWYLFEKYQSMEPSHFSGYYKQNPSNNLLYDKIIDWRNIWNNEEENQKNQNKKNKKRYDYKKMMHEIYFRYSCASIIKIILESYGTYVENDYLFIKYYIDQYKEMFKFTYKFLFNINKKKKDDINQKQYNYGKNNDSIHQCFGVFEKACSDLEKKIKSYGNVTIESDSIQLLKKAMSEGVNDFKKTQYCKKIIDELQWINNEENLEEAVEKEPKEELEEVELEKEKDLKTELRELEEAARKEFEEESEELEELEELELLCTQYTAVEVSYKNVVKNDEEQDEELQNEKAIISNRLPECIGYNRKDYTKENAIKALTDFSNNIFAKNYMQNMIKKAKKMLLLLKQSTEETLSLEQVKEFINQANRYIGEWECSLRDQSGCHDYGYMHIESDFNTQNEKIISLLDRAIKELEEAVEKESKEESKEAARKELEEAARKELEQKLEQVRFDIEKKLESVQNIIALFDICSLTEKIKVEKFIEKFIEESKQKLEQESKEESKEAAARKLKFLLGGGIGLILLAAYCLKKYKSDPIFMTISDYIESIFSKKTTIS